MKKLWEKNYDTDQLLEQFTVGQDRELDLFLAKYDVQGSRAHAKMLARIGLLTPEECEGLLNGLDDIYQMIEAGQFQIDEGIEDVHSQIEFLLTAKLGDVGKKIHSGRSRNDQVLTAVKLMAKDELLQIAELVKDLFELLMSHSDQYKEVLMPGYTHMQVAMPSSFGLWFGAYAESLADDLILLEAAYRIVDKNPLGSAAGYGSSFPLDRQFTSDEMGFGGLNVNVVYAQMTRGKTERTVATAISAIAATLSKMAMDVCLYNGQNFGFLKLPDRYTTGSSIMPHKKNPDGFELVRGKCNQLQALPVELSYILNNLPSGYHRDLQTTKEHFVPAYQTLKDCLMMSFQMLKHITVNEEIVADTKYDDMFSVERVNELVLQGIPFRDAYKQVGLELSETTESPDRTLNHQHVGSLGNLRNDLIRQSFNDTYAFFSKHQEVSQ
ncbi:MAG: argininosuccinate lyase [Bacteroidota bacterium]